MVGILQLIPVKKKFEERGSNNLIKFQSSHLVIQFVIHTYDKKNPNHKKYGYDNRVNKDKLHYFLYFK